VVGPPPRSWSVDAPSAGAREVLPGLWRLRLPLPWAEIPHVNAFVIDIADGVMLVDCGPAGDSSCEESLHRALAQTGHSLADVRLLVGTHTHSDHIGLAAFVREQTGAELWMHAATEHFYNAMRDPEGVQAARERRARAEGVPEDLLGEFRDVREETEGVIAPVDPDRELVDGMRLPSALGDWEVVETPGHSPSHVCLVQRERGLVILGDLLSPVFTPYFDYGYSPDPIAEYLQSLERLETMGGLTLGLPGHGRPLEDVDSLIVLHRRSVEERLAATQAVVDRGAYGAWEITAQVFGERPSGMGGVSHVGEVMAYLLHLRRQGTVVRNVGPDGTFTYAPADPSRRT
jgi:glyoxylase-like metal-dependent hydrolase (beta-lactamase superfamily II)